MASNHTLKLNPDLTEKVRGFLEQRHPGVTLTKKASVELALSEWLREAQKVKSTG